jgi:hypothetical protein
LEKRKLPCPEVPLEAGMNFKQSLVNTISAGHLFTCRVASFYKESFAFVLDILNKNKNSILVGVLRDHLWGDGDQEDCSSRPAWAKKLSSRPHLKQYSGCGGKHVSMIPVMGEA